MATDESEPVRLINSHFMGNAAGQTLPRRWHADFDALPGKVRICRYIQSTSPKERSQPQAISPVPQTRYGRIAE